VHLRTINLVILSSAPSSYALLYCGICYCVDYLYDPVVCGLAEEFLRAKLDVDAIDNGEVPGVARASQEERAGSDDMDGEKKLD